MSSSASSISSGRADSAEAPESDDTGAASVSVPASIAYSMTASKAPINEELRRQCGWFPQRPISRRGEVPRSPLRPARAPLVRAVPLGAGGLPRAQPVAGPLRLDAPHVAAVGVGPLADPDVQFVVDRAAGQPDQLDPAAVVGGDGPGGDRAPAPPIAGRGPSVHQRCGDRRRRGSVGGPVAVRVQLSGQGLEFSATALTAIGTVRVRLDQQRPDDRCGPATLEVGRPAHHVGRRGSGDGHPPRRRCRAAHRHRARR